MNARNHARLRNHQLSQREQRAINRHAEYFYGFEDDDYDEFGDERGCTHCGGDGYCEVDDPLWDDCDEYGWGDCPACSGTGKRKHQTIF